MKIVFLGTGWLNAPLIGHPSWVDETMGVIRQRIRRTTPAFVIQPDGADGPSILVDAGSDITDQWFGWKEGPAQPDALIVTHSHIDHIGGIADLTHCHPPLPTYATQVTQERMALFGHAVHPTPDPRMQGLDRRILPTHGVTTVCGLSIETIPVNHDGPTVPDTALLVRHDGRFFAHLSDTNGQIEPELRAKLAGVDLLVINTPIFRDMSSHIGVEEAIQLSYEVKAKHLVLTHINYDMDPDALAELERRHPHVTVAYDGLTVDIASASSDQEITQ